MAARAATLRGSKHEIRNQHTITYSLKLQCDVLSFRFLNFSSHTHTHITHAITDLNEKNTRILVRPCTSRSPPRCAMPTVFGVSVDDAKASRALSLYMVDGSVCIGFALCAYIIIWVELPKRCFLGSVFMYIYIRLALSSYVGGFFCDVMTPALAMIFVKLNIIFVQSTVDKSIYRTGASRVFFWGVVFDVLLSLHSCIF